MRRGGFGRLALACAIPLAWGCVQPGHEERGWEAFGQPAFAEVHTTSARDAGPVLDDVRRAIAEVEGWVRPPDGRGGLARVNAEASTGYYHFREEERDYYRCVLLALDYAKASRGAFDPTVGPLTRLYVQGKAAPREAELLAALPGVGWDKVSVAPEARAIHFRSPGMQLDLGGIVKGFALDMAARAFSRPGSRAGLLRIGGNLYAWGEPPGAESWSVEVPDPRSPARPLLRLLTTNRGVAVSGRSQPAAAAAPVLESETGRPVSGSLIAAVAVADSGADADAMSTALFVAGYHRAADLLSRTRRVEAVLLVEDERGAPRVVASASLEGRLELAAETDAETGGRIRYLLPPESIDLPF